MRLAPGRGRSVIKRHGLGWEMRDRIPCRPVSTSDCKVQIANFKMQIASLPLAACVSRKWRVSIASGLTELPLAQPFRILFT